MLKGISIVPLATFDLWCASAVGSLNSSQRTDLVVGSKLNTVLCFCFDNDLDYRTEWGPHLYHPRMQNIWSSDYMELRATRTTCKGFWSDVQNPIYANTVRK